jgi:CDP-glucose 4,6-dehydratase
VSTPDPAFWRGRRVLVTGHTGFKGAWLTLWLEKMGAEVSGLALAPEGDRPLYARLAATLRVKSHIVDLRDADGVAGVVAAEQPEIILHLAAQALVRRSYAQPAETYAVNVDGTINVLEAARRAPGVRAVLVVTSDKVYANNESGRRFIESDPLGGKDPYSNSKACVELVAQSWRASFLKAAGIACVTARAGNVIGGGDVAADRLIPDFFRALDSNQTLKLRNPASTRPWQHVLEPIAGYLRYAEAMVAGAGGLPEALNFGPDADSEWTVARVVDGLTAHLGMGGWTQDGDPGPAEAKTLALDASLAGDSLGWRPALDLPTALAWTADYWLAARAGRDIRQFCLSQIEAYRERVV